MRRYLAVVIGTAGVTTLIYFSTVLCLSPALIPAEYWVRQMIVVKRSIVERHRGERKIVVAGGSNVLFGVDAKQLSTELNIPVINMGLHAGLRLERILQEASSAVGPGDTLVLALEPAYYSSDEITAWQARNVIAWEPESWVAYSLPLRLRTVSQIEPGVIFELCTARLIQVFRPDLLHERLAAFDDAATLDSFKVAPPPTSFAYSVNHLDSLGDMQMIDGAAYHGSAPTAEKVISLSPRTKDLLMTFSKRLRERNVALYLANTPWIETKELNHLKVQRASQILTEQLAPVAPFLDDRNDLIFPRREFLNSYLHLNTQGREVRTELLVKALRKIGAVPIRTEAPEK